MGCIQIRLDGRLGGMPKLDREYFRRFRGASPIGNWADDVDKEMVQSQRMGISAGSFLVLLLAL
jgi:hypothetical protein